MQRAHAHPGQLRELFDGIAHVVDLNLTGRLIDYDVTSMSSGHTPFLPNLQFPTAQHAQAAEMAAQFFAPLPQVDTVLVVNSCARGQATAESDLDMAILVQPDTPSAQITALEVRWRTAAHDAHLHELVLLHLDVISGQYAPTVWDDGGGPDYFEVEIGNQVAYSAPLDTAGAYYRQLQAQWLPYYSEMLRASRLRMLRAACAYDLDFIPFYVGRELYFQAFDRLYKAFQEFLQALFIARRTYPLAYNKWIRLQVEHWLGLPALYRALPTILSVSNLESDELTHKSHMLRDLLKQWTAE
jgi:predicted nucleotidyltransferase